MYLSGKKILINKTFNLLEYQPEQIGVILMFMALLIMVEKLKHAISPLVICNLLFVLKNFPATTVCFEMSISGLKSPQHRQVGLNSPHHRIRKTINTAKPHVPLLFATFCFLCNCRVKNFLSTTVCFEMSV